MLKRLSDLIAASSGSTCSINKPSNVLKAIGYKEKDVREIIRFSFSNDIDLSEFDKYLNALK